MKKQMVLAMVCVALLLGGCTGPGMKLSSKGQFYNLESSSTGALDPSLKTLITFYCSPQEGRYEEVATEDGIAKCHGRFIVLDVNQGKQTGYLTGVFSSAMQGAAFAGGMYLLGNGIGDSGSQTTNNNDTSSNGGNSNSLSSSRSEAFSNSNAAAAATGQGGNGYGGSAKGGSVDMGKKHRR